MAPTPPADEDTAAVRLVVAGDVAAFDGIVKRWQGRLVTLAWRFCRDRTMAEDMAQEAFVRAFRALHTFRGDAAFSTWLTAIAMNTYRSCLRGAQRSICRARRPADPIRSPGSGIRNATSWFDERFWRCRRSTASRSSCFTFRRWISRRRRTCSRFPKAR